MVFSSLLFMFIFLPIFFVIYYVSPKGIRNLVLLIASLIFYAWGEPIYIFIMLFSTVFDYTIGLFIHKFREKRSVARIFLITSVVVNLSLLGFFKYTDFFISNINGIFGASIGLLNIALPIGNSFYTFQTMSYTIDLYRGKIGVQKNIISFGAYISMFPQLIAGPIVTYSHVEKEINQRTISWDKFGEGTMRFIEGLGKKVLIANNIGLLWENVKALPQSELTLIGSWLGIMAFALQLYFDFSGYSDMAIGLGKMMGFQFPENFNYPYISRSITEFWRRWHITLGSWFREYVYIPLGGNRVGSIRLYMNLFVVWFLTGFWHGAGWNFIIWGLYFSVLLVLEKSFLIRLFERLPTFFSRIYLIVAVLISWVFFSLEKMDLICQYLSTMFGLGGTAVIDNNTLYLILNYLVLFIIAVLFATPLMDRIKGKINRWVLYGFYMAVLFLSTAYLVDSTFNPFLYFRF